MILYRLAITNSENVRLPLVVTKNLKLVHEINNCVNKIINDKENLNI
jgi:hypothetical protein